MSVRIFVIIIIIIMGINIIRNKQWEVIMIKINIGKRSFVFAWSVLLVFLLCGFLYTKSGANFSNLNGILKVLVGISLISMSFGSVHDAFRYFSGRRVRTSTIKNVLIAVFAIVTVSTCVFAMAEILRMPDFNTLINQSFSDKIYYFKYMLVAIVFACFTYLVRKISEINK